MLAVIEWRRESRSLRLSRDFGKHRAIVGHRRRKRNPMEGIRFLFDFNWTTVNGKDAPLVSSCATSKDLSSLNRL